MGERDRAEIADFLLALEGFLIDEAPNWVSPESREDFLAAGQRLLERELVGSVRIQLREGAADIDARLEEVGLTGEQLQFKLSGFRRALDWFVHQRGLRPFRRVLRWADVILGSLVRVFPLLDPVKELKEGLEADVDDQLDAALE